MTARENPEPLKGIALVLAGISLSLANFIVLLDITIANVSVPHIAGGLAISPTQGTWAITSYAVAEAITVPLAGWLTARFGTVRWLIFCLSGFGFFSLLCGFATSIEMLVVCRVFQGLCGGPMMPISQSLLTRVFPESKRSMALSLWGITTVCAPIAGPILGGFISDNLSWPWIFFINLPVVAGCILFAVRTLPEYETAKVRSPIDAVGLALLIIWISAFQLMLDIGRDHDWFGSPIVVVLAVVAGLGFVTFIIWELFDENPVVNIRLLADRTLLLSNVVMALAYGAFFMSMVLVPLWLQQTMRYTATLAGFAVATGGVSALLLSPLAASLINRVDLRLIVGGGILCMSVFSLGRMGWYTGSTYDIFARTQFFLGMGMPFFAIGITSLALINIPQKDMTSAAGILTFVRVMSGAMGTAIATTMWETSLRQYHADLAVTMNGVTDAIARVAQLGASAEQARSLLETTVDRQAATLGALHVFSFSGVVFGIAALIVFFIPRPKGAIRSMMGH